ncbi:MAG TPA: condensation domain-containing protein, partial [Thermoanaerobaculia bacterium]|nr:condensation domain-containing protein [Thermoanaerobaculia bacterium]
MTTAQLLSRLRDLEVRLWAEEDRLCFHAPKGAITPEIREALGRHKPEVLALLRGGRSLAEGAGPEPGPAPESGPASLSFAQRRIWFLTQLEPESAAYNITRAARLEGRVRVEVLERSLAEVVRRHAILRTSFTSREGEPSQIAHPPAGLALPVIDLQALPAEARRVEADRLAAEEARRPFDLRRPPLLRVFALRLAAEEHVLPTSLHHIAGDAWSTAILFRELGALYEAFSRGLPSPLPEPPLQYTDYARWQRGRLAGALLEEQLAYWTEQLADAPPSLELPADRPRSAAASFRGTAHLSLVPPATVARLQAFTRLQSGEEGGTTPFMVLAAAFATLLARWSGQDDLVVGLPVANRGHTSLEGLIGLFLDTVALRVRLGGDPTFSELLGRTRQATLGAYAHQDLPFERLVEALRPERQLHQTPIFQVVLSLQNVPRSDLAASSFRLSLLPPTNPSAQFDLVCDMEEAADGLRISWRYRTDLFDATTIARLGEQYQLLLESALEDPGRPIAELPLLDPARRHQMLVEWNGAGVPATEPVCLHERFAEQAAARPDSVAVSFEDLSLTYGELALRARRLAGRLRALGVGPDVRVGVRLERPAEMVVSLLGVLEAGGAYVPLDPGYPAERLDFMARDADLRVVIDQAWIAPDGGDPSKPEATPPDALAYVIYTSGSTGRPKGVGISHAAADRLFTATVPWFGFGPGDVWTLFHSFAFDFSVWEMWGALLHGGRVVVVPERVRRSPEELLDLLVREGVTVLDQTPSSFRQLMAVEGEGPALPLALRWVIFGGEALDFQSLAPWMARHGDSRPRLVNMYGITETTVHVTYREVTLGDLPEIPRGGGASPPGRGVVGSGGGQEGGFPGSAAGEAAGASVKTAPLLTSPAPTHAPAQGGRHHHPLRPELNPSLLGVAIPDLQVYLADRGSAPVPIGVPGEVWVGGAGLARGYLGRPDLTADRFRPHPWSETPGARTYRSGDLARRRPDGDLEYLGRIDHQVKIRGYRVELGEVEAALTAFPGVRQAAAVVSEARLLGYVVGEPGVPLDLAALRAFLEGRLPGPFVPSALVPLAALPITPGGKLDRAALAQAGPVPEPAAPISAPAAAGPVAEALAGIWAEVLGVKAVGPGDDFFRLGGHSLLATAVLSRVRRAFRVELPVAALFEAPTLAGFAARIESEMRGGESFEGPPLVARPRYGGAPLSYSQRRLWFLDRLAPGNPFYNVPVVLRLRGGLRPAALEAALAEIVRRHEILRSALPELDGEPVQAAAPALDVRLPLVDVSGLPEEIREGEADRLADEEGRRPFDLAAGPLFRFSLLRTEPGDHRLLLTLHHVVTDAGSMGVLRRELETFYEGGASLPDLPLQYADFALWQRDWIAAGGMEGQLAWWKERLAGAPEEPGLPFDRPRPARERFRGGAVPLRLPVATAAAVRAAARREGMTSFMVLLGAFQALLARLTGEEDVVVGTPVANRARPEIEGLIGFFSNTLVLRTDLSADPEGVELLDRARQTALAAYAHQDLPFEVLVEALAPERHLARNPLFQVLLVYQRLEGKGGLSDLAGLLVDGAPPQGAAGTGSAKFDLTLALVEGEETFEGAVEYDADLFDPPTAARIAGQLTTLLAELAGDSPPRLGDLPLLLAPERHQLAVEWNDVRDEMGLQAAGSPVHAGFEAWAGREPAAPAVVWNDSTLTYGELERLSAALASRLR